jgi:O-antigen ligase
MIVWSIFAVGAVYAWAAVPLMVAAALLAGLSPPKPGASRETRMLDALLAASAAAAALQILPLPFFVQAAISPNAWRVPAAIQLQPADATWRTISVAPLSSLYAVALVLTCLVVFWVARQCCAFGMTKQIVRHVALAGLVASLLAIGLRTAGDPTLIYGRWQALETGARPFGPFVNRNHFATWLLMACPLAAGYVIASIALRPPASGVAARFVATSKSLATGFVWVGVAGLVMVMALVVSTSRSGLIALGLSLAGGSWMVRRRVTPRNAIIALMVLVAFAGTVAAYVNTRPVLARVEETLTKGAGGRTHIWRETWRIIHDFPVTGTGLGSYETAMLAYQQGDRSFLINQAHNQYLHLFADGGLMIGVPVLMTVVAFIHLFRVRLAKDTSEWVWLRIGAGIAILAVAVQGIWETGLRIPANGLLFAVTAAIAVHRPDTGTRRT